MHRKIKMMLLCVTNLFCVNLSFAAEHTFNLSPSYEFILPGNEPQIFTNTFFWVVEAKCTIESENENTPFSFKVLRKSGSLNGIQLSKDDNLDLIVHPGDQLYITAASGGRVELTNHGDQTIKATCSSGK